MSVKSIIKKSAIIAASLISTTSIANAKVQYNVGLGTGIGLLEFSGVLKGDTKDPLANSPFLAGKGGAPTLRTTYKYVEQQPTRSLYLEAGFQKSYDSITLLDKNFFAGANLNFSWGKSGGSEGLTNPNGRYMSTGDTSIMLAINGKFGLENSFSKIYGLVGLTYAKTDLPFDILPFGNNTTFGELATCTVFEQGSSLLENINGSPLQPMIDPFAGLIQTACNRLDIKDASYNNYFANIGVGIEANLFKDFNLFAEVVHLMQINRNKTKTVKYTANGVNGTFSGALRATNTTYMRLGFRYYFG